MIKGHVSPTTMRIKVLARDARSKTKTFNRIPTLRPIAMSDLLPQIKARSVTYPKPTLFSILAGFME